MAIMKKPTQDPAFVTINTDSTLGVSAPLMYAYRSESPAFGSMMINPCQH